VRGGKLPQLLDVLLDALSDRPTTYLIVAGIIFVDDFIPLARGDTAMIIAGILAASGAARDALMANAVPRRHAPARVPGPTVTG
jgi:hypothetical protein